MIEVLLTLVATIILTFIVGSLVGYCMHLFMHTKFARMKYLSFIAHSHRVHHRLYHIRDYESETYRSAGKDNSAFVFVPVITISILLLCVGFWFVFQSWWIYPIILVEGTAIGWLNNKIHECFHIKNHWLNKYKLFRELKRLHWIHHKHPKTNQGIIWFGPDKLFGSFKN